MGLIRKTLAVGTLGAVKGSSKKQRTAKAILQEAQRQTAILDGSAAREAEAEARKRTTETVIPLGTATTYTGSAPADVREEIERQQFRG